MWEWWPRGYSWKAIGRFGSVVVASQCRLTYPEQLSNSRSTALVATWTTVWDIDKLHHPWPLVQTNWDSLVSTLILIDSFLFSTMTSYRDVFTRKCTCYTWLRNWFPTEFLESIHTATQTPKPLTQVWLQPYKAILLYMVPGPHLRKFMTSLCAP